jgi:hypothetical protein
LLGIIQDSAPQTDVVVAVDSPVSRVCSLPEAWCFRFSLDVAAVDSPVPTVCSLPEASVLQRICCCLRFSRVSRDSSLPEASFLADDAHCLHDWRCFFLLLCSRYPCGAHGPQMRLSFQLTEFAFRVGTLFDEPMCMHAWGVSLRVCTQCTFFSTNEINDGPLQEPQYYSYTDPNMGEPSPTFGARTPLADMALLGWGYVPHQEDCSSFNSCTKFFNIRTAAAAAFYSICSAMLNNHF